MMGWDGESDWRSVIIERRVFGTCCGGCQGGEGGRKGLGGCEVGTDRGRNCLEEGKLVGGGWVGGIRVEEAGCEL